MQGTWRWLVRHINLLFFSLDATGLPSILGLCVVAGSRSEELDESGHVTRSKEECYTPTVVQRPTSSDGRCWCGGGYLLNS
ncbi:hypothetical protein BDU57DRAFT_519542 [Ampelomyces quisqualis]|uniref:Uncharacterized protein n=1 Tax=Ampelomyces quisqualis TaxID=50730 RepID=A0A6A5QJ34_AMPQU|nr:hypothetical protein BDU57DRAFT_519542 [Ampelomyces quisqualis]